MADLSILIPARDERYLPETVADIFAHAQGDTEVVVVYDGAWPDVGLPDDPRLHIIHHPVSIGQRAAVNEAARVSQAPYVMKLDAHCALAPGFDVELIRTAKDLGPTVTQIPSMFNLHVFDLKCLACGAMKDQCPTPATCWACGVPGPFERVKVWTTRRPTAHWVFDAELHYQTAGELGYRREYQGELYDVMSCLGACWFLSRARYWQLGGLDEAHGSWGQMGTELACKSWLSGGRMVVNRRTWFAHAFRTQGGDWGFSYPLTGEQVEAARRYSRALWRGNTWPHQVRPLSWLVEKFWPVKGWTEDARAALSAGLSAGCVWYTDGRLDAHLLNTCRAHLKTARGNLPVAEVWRPEAEPRGPLAMFRQILRGLEALDTDFAFLTEHDVLYAPEHFEFRPPRRDTYYYNVHTWKVDVETGRAVTYLTQQTSGLCADRQLLITHYRERIRRCEAEGFTRAMGFEPGSHGRAERVDDVPSAIWRAPVPNIDLRHGTNLTESRWTPDQFRNPVQDWHEAPEVPGWGRTAGRMAEFLSDVGVSHAHSQAL